MLEVGNIVRSIYAIGIVIQIREGARDGRQVAQVFWFRRGDAGWVKANDMEVVSA